VSPGGQPLAGFGDRLLARLVDWVIAGAVASLVTIPAYLAVFFYVFGRLQYDEYGDVAEPSLWSVLLPWILLYAGILLFLLLLTYLYEVELLLRRRGQSFGKQATRIRVVPMDPTATLNRGTATRRWLIFGVAGILVPGFTYVDGLWQLGDRPHRQCLHDKFAGTVVVKDTP
jgi:uncharacterized RDD family membrane protein YckC